MFKKRFSVVQVVDAEEFNYKVIGWSGKKWEVISYNDFLWTAKRSARRAAKRTWVDSSICFIHYEVINYESKAT